MGSNSTSNSRKTTRLVNGVGEKNVGLQYIDPWDGRGYTRALLYSYVGMQRSCMGS